MKTILLVEDEENDIFFMKRAFKKAGILEPLYVVRDGQQALDYLNGVGPYAERERFPLPSVTLLDLKLPQLTGLEVLKTVREHPKLRSLVIIILTSSRLQSDIDAAYDIGANGFLVKPSTPEEMVEIARILKTFWLGLNQVASICEPTAEVTSV